MPDAQTDQTQPLPRIKRAKPKNGWWRLVPVAKLLASMGICLLVAHWAVQYAMAQVELPDSVKLPSSSQVFDRHGRLIATYRNEVTRFLIDTTTLPDRVRHAVIAAEDRDFFDHDGLSLTGMVRATWANVTSGEVQQGGSTITQQYVKNAILQDSSRTIERKFKEAILSIKLEKEYSKAEILDKYLNTVYFGRGAYGIEAAARAYFSKHAEDLNLSETAYLAGLIPAPSRYQPSPTNDAAIDRRDYILSVMRSEGYIDQRAEQRAKRAKLRFHTSSDVNPRQRPAAYFLEWLRKDYLYPRFGECLYTCGLKIHTTLDLDMQQTAEEAVAASLDEKTHPQAALVSMTPKGRIRAFVGGRQFDDSKAARGYNYATDGGRQPGSAFKPFTLLAAIEDGISTSSRFSGESPKTIDDPACAGPDGIWEPENYGGSSYGTLDLEQATAQSVNTVYAELVAEIGPEKVADLVERFGFTGPGGTKEIDPFCSLSLGTLDVSPLQMARAFAGISARGVLPKVSPIRFVENKRGRCMLGFDAPDKLKCKKNVDIEGKRVVDENSADVLAQTLTGVVESGTAAGSVELGRPAAGKTGTTQDHRDAWFAGFVPQLTTVVWMGYPVDKGPDGKLGTADDFTPLMGYCDYQIQCGPVDGIEVTGGSFPATIWNAFMYAVLEGSEIEYFPEPVYEPTTVINPLPPPPPPEEEGDKEKDKDQGNEDAGNGNGNSSRHDDD